MAKNDASVTPTVMMTSDRRGCGSGDGGACACGACVCVSLAENGYL